MKEKKCWFFFIQVPESPNDYMSYVKKRVITHTWLGASGSEDKWWRLAAFQFSGFLKYS